MRPKRNTHVGLLMYSKVKEMYIFTNRALILTIMSRRMVIKEISSAKILVDQILCMSKRKKLENLTSFPCSFCRKIHTNVSHNFPMSHAALQQLILKKKREKRLKGLETKKKILDETPSVVKMMLQTAENDDPVDDVDLVPKDQNMLDSYLSKEELSKRLEEIKWDFKAVKEQSKLMSVEQQQVSDEIQMDTYEDPHIPDKDSEFIESILLDEKQSKVKEGKNVRVVKIWGTPDPGVPMTDIPCVGCGAKLHCTNTTVPGYMPSEKFKTLTMEELKKSICQRCYLVEYHKFCLNIKATENEFEKIIEKIKNERALILVLIDLSDIDNSILKGLVKLVGHRRPLVLIGNKVDLIPRDGHGYLERIKEEMFNACKKAGLVNKNESNIKLVKLISAKTGYGVEALITKLMLSWKLEGNVYLVGNTNTGKSTFFNTLLMSDYCKSSVREAVHRATVSVWPGTTISLLKFPIVNPTPWRLEKRKARILKDRKQFQEEAMLLKSRIKEKSRGAWKIASLQGFVGCTDFRGKTAIDLEKEELNRIEGYDIPSFEMKFGNLEMKSGKRLLEISKEEIKFDDTMFKMSRWLYDTPGVINNEQLINILEQEELNLVLPTGVIEPRIFVVKQGQVMFVSGLSRIDYIEGDQPFYINVFTSKDLKVHILDGCDADDFYQENIGQKTLGVPLGKQDRLNKIPSLIGRQFDVIGASWKVATADIQLSSLGWVSVTLGRDLFARLRVYTPGGRGMNLRQPSLLPNIMAFQGKRVKGSPRFVTRKPQLE